MRIKTELLVSTSLPSSYACNVVHFFNISINQSYYIFTWRINNCFKSLWVNWFGSYVRLQKNYAIILEVFRRIQVYFSLFGTLKFVNGCLRWVGWLSIICLEVMNFYAPGWKRQDHPNLRLFWFEAMKKDPKRVIAEIAQHTGYSLSEKELESIEEYTR